MIDAIERVQQCSLLCADTLSQMAMTRFVSRAIDDGSLRALRRSRPTSCIARPRASRCEAIDEHLQRPRLTTDGRALHGRRCRHRRGRVRAARAARPPACSWCRAAASGRRSRNGVRISYGPLVMHTDEDPRGPRAPRPVDALVSALSGFLDFAIDAAWQAGRLTLAHYQTGVTVERKPDRSAVTIADREAEQLLRRLIEARFPDHAIVGEEFGGRQSRRQPPLDRRSDRRHQLVRPRRAVLRRAGRARDRGRAGGRRRVFSRAG